MVKNCNGISSLSYAETVLLDGLFAGMTQLKHALSIYDFVH